MKIAQVAPLYESCPPKLYGGTERVVSYLTEELVRAGHAVTLFASGDSETSAELRAVCPQSLRLVAGYGESLPYHLVMLNRVMEAAQEFDVIHFHTEFLHFPLFNREREKTLTTLHGRLDLAELPIVYHEFPSMPVVSISDAQRQALPWLSWRGTIHHGLPLDAYDLGDGGGGHLAFLGRICPEKRPDRAIEIAKRAGVPLVIAAKVDKVDTDYFEHVIRPMLDHPLVDYIGEIDEAQKAQFLGEARALLFPIDWPEPFGMVMIEAMACGTPVVAYHHGSVPEVVDEGITGFVVDNETAAVAAVQMTAGLDRAAVRARFEARFSVERMAEDYLAIYAAMASGIIYDFVTGAPTPDTNFVSPISAA
jgi:glycosyltransferase involved in cell wall biosynthesis